MFIVSSLKRNGVPWPSGKPKMDPRKNKLLNAERRKQQFTSSLLFSELIAECHSSLVSDTSMAVLNADTALACKMGVEYAWLCLFGQVPHRRLLSSRGQNAALLPLGLAR